MGFLSIEAASGEAASGEAASGEAASGEVASGKADRLKVALGLCVALVAGGLYLRLQALGFPEGLSWDEHHFVENARNYLNGKPDWNDHPPFGKLLMALSMHWLGDTASAFRLPSAVFGLGTMVIGALIARRLFRYPLAAPVAAACFAVDGFFIAYSRAALLDGMLTCLLMLSFYLALVARRWTTMGAAAVVAGIALSVKTSGLLAFGPIVYFSLLAKRPAWLLTIAASLLLFYGQWALGLHMTGKPYDPASAWQTQYDLMKHHAVLTEMKHPLTSRWFTWLIPVQPIRMRSDGAPGDMVRIMTTLGHPLLWWCTSLLAGLVSLRLFIFGARSQLLDPVVSSNPPDDRSDADSLDATSGPSAAGRSSHLKRLENTGFFTQHRTAVTSLVLMWWLQLSPWILTRRDSYVYHYLPAYSFGLLISAGFIAHLAHRRPALGLAALSAVAAIALFYAPVWGQLPISHSAAALRLWLPGWR